MPNLVKIRVIPGQMGEILHYVAFTDIYGFLRLNGSLIGVKFCTALDYIT